ncbi:hypothetical protein AB0E69_11005 [Kribbella sp. NPDC026611]|uniref:hypothetical protein n=1 Tax=Kribbella sp. NPDC026611 TaxID=3154911 RepID=UPI0033F8A0AE
MPGPGGSDRISSPGPRRSSYTEVLALAEFRAMLLVGLGEGCEVFVHSVADYAAGTLVWTCGEIGLATMFGATFAALAPADLRGRYLGLAGTACWGVGAVIGPLVGSTVFDRAGPTALWSSAAALGALLALIQLCLATPLRRRLISRSGLA